MSDLWERIRHLTVDEIVTKTKLHGSAMSLNGYTTPEGWPFVIVVAVAKPGNERVVAYAREFHEKMSAAGAPVAQAVRTPAGPYRDRKRPPARGRSER
jgi:hypothetical protein